MFSLRPAFADINHMLRRARLLKLYNNWYICMNDQIRPVIWIGSSRRDLRAMPQQVRRDIGQALYAAQQGMTDPAAKPLKGLGGGGRVMEIVERYRTDAYRAIYTAHFEDAVYVLHVFQKKSRSGIATPKHQIELIRKRFAEAERHHRERWN